MDQLGRQDMQQIRLRDTSSVSGTRLEEDVESTCSGGTSDEQPRHSYGGVLMREGGNLLSDGHR